MRLKSSKCHFLMPEVTYLGYVVSENGLCPAADKIHAVQKAPVPSTVSELKSFYDPSTTIPVFFPTFLHSWLLSIIFFKRMPSGPVVLSNKRLLRLPRIISHLHQC